MADREEPVVELRLDTLLFLRNVPAGLDISVIGHWVMILKKTTEPVNPPITVHPEGDTGFYRVTDGRHRVIASYVAGRDTILTTTEPKVDNPQEST